MPPSPPALVAAPPALVVGCGLPRRRQTGRPAFAAAAAAPGGGGRLCCRLALPLACAAAAAQRTRSRKRLRSTRSASRVVSSEGPSSPQKSIFVAIFLHLLSFTMGLPVLPALRQHFAIPAARTGLITSAYPAGMLVAVFLLPALSDRVGRKPVLVLSYAGVGCGFLLQALAVRLGWPLWVFVALRAASGLFAGASTVVKAYIADVARGEELPRFLGYREAAGSLAYIAGPTVGGLVFSRAGLPALIACSGATSVTAALLVAARLRSPAVQPGVAVGAAAPGSAREDISGNRWAVIASVAAASFAYNVAQSFFDGFFGMFCWDTFGWRASSLGVVLTCLACAVLCNSAFLYTVLVGRLGVVRASVAGLLAVSAGLTLMGSGSVPGVVAALALYAFGVPVFNPGVSAMLASAAPPGRRGFVLGVDSAMNSMGRILAPLALGLLYGASPGAAFRLAGLVALAGAALLAAQQGRIRRLMP